MRRFLAAFPALVLTACATHDAPRPAQDAQRQITLVGDLTRADHQTYRELPFKVPAGVDRITIDLVYDRANRTVIDLGLRDPDGPRGWSGGNKSRIVIAETDATPSYRAGPLTPGTWTLVLGVPSIREGVTAHFSAKVTFDAVKSAAGASAFADAPLATSSGWRRGDFHTHTGHSDGACANGAGERVPCPVIRTLEAAQRAKLDFVAITDHNTLSQAEALRELQPAFPALLLIPGTEVTTFHGHANAIGITRPVEFQLGSKRLPKLVSLLDAVEAQAAILSINHPAQPSGEDCMGCGWTVPDTDYSRIAAIEAMNGGSVRAGKVEGSGSGLAFWQQQLDAGFRITAIGGSDNHDATDAAGKSQSPVGTPATVIWMKDLSQRSVLDGLRSGRVFIDMENRPGRVLDISAKAGASEPVAMGGTLLLGAGEKATVSVHVEGLRDLKVEFVASGVDIVAGRNKTEATITLKQGASSAWVRANVREPSGKLLLVGNPIYIRPR